MPETDGDLDLADAVRAIRRELKSAMEEGRDEELRLRLGPVELELQLEIARATGVEGDVRVWVASIGGRKSSAVTKTHTIRLTLHPENRGGEDVDIHGTVAGDRPIE